MLKKAIVGRLDVLGSGVERLKLFAFYRPRLGQEQQGRRLLADFRFWPVG
jgi:hypothetical protein